MRQCREHCRIDPGAKPPSSLALTRRDTDLINTATNMFDQAWHLDRRRPRLSGLKKPNPAGDFQRFETGNGTLRQTQQPATNDGTDATRVPVAARPHFQGRDSGPDPEELPPDQGLAGSSSDPAALSAFHVSIDPYAECDDRLGSSGAGTKGKMARLEGAISNPKGSQARPRAGRSGRPIGDVREANCREIRKMARLEGNSSNALFETLQDWEHQLKHSEIDFKAISQKPKGPQL